MPSACPSTSTAIGVAPACSASRNARASGPSSSALGRPTRTLWPSTVADAPRPGSLVNSDASGTSSPAALTIARAMGCSDPASTAAARRSASSRPVTSTTAISPLVTVPVLSITTVSTWRVDSSISGPLISRPSCAPRPVPTRIAVGVARPRAQGHAMMRTATAARNASLTPLPTSRCPTRATTEMAMMVGTNTREIRSTSRSTGALPDCASLTSLPIWASVVSLPTRVASTTRRPDVLSVAPVTLAPSSTSTGTDSPVSMEASIAECPDTTRPSVAIFSPGRTTKRSPTWTSAIGTRTSLSPRSTLASFAPMLSSSRSAAELCPFARVSNHLPSSRNVITTQTDSR